MSVAAASDFERLLSDSPFVPPRKQQNAPSKKEENKNPLQEQFEFRGLMEWGGDYSFSIYNKSEKKSHWLGINDPVRDTDFRVTSFDAQSQQVMVRLGEQEAFLQLMEASNRGILKPRGSLSGQPFPLDTPAPPPALEPPPSPPPPPPLSSPPPGPPPDIPPEVLKRFQQLKDENPQMSRDFLAAGVSGGPQAPPTEGISGLPALNPTTAQNGNSDAGGSGNTGNNPTSGVQIPNLPGLNPGQSPPTGPPDITIPDIPNFPED